jgi:Holliday junction DNA helicase RuvB
MLDIDELGLDRVDRQLLRLIAIKFGGGPVGLDTLGAALSEESETIEDVYEPYLLQLGFIQRTPRGRIITPDACRHIGVAVQEPETRQSRLFQP